MLERLTEQVTILAACFDVLLTDARLQIYVLELADIPQERLEFAFRKARREAKWFPKISELRQLAGVHEASAEDAGALAAWSVAVDYAAKWVQADIYGAYAPDQGCRTSPMPTLSQRLLDTVRVSGGWRVLKCMGPSDFPFQQKRFVEAYSLWNHLNSVVTDRLIIPGEQHRALAGYTTQEHGDTDSQPGPVLNHTAKRMHGPPLTDAGIAESEKLSQHAARMASKQPATGAA